MSSILIFALKWNKAYRVLRYGNGFGLLIPYAMGCGWHVAERVALL